MKQLKKTICLLLTVVMCVSLLPTAYADGSDPEPKEYVFPTATVKLADILWETGITLTENKYSVKTDSSLLKLGSEELKAKELDGFTLTALDSFYGVTVTVESNNGKDKHVLTLYYTAPNPVEPEQLPDETGGETGGETEEKAAGDAEGENRSRQNRQHFNGNGGLIWKR